MKIKKPYKSKSIKSMDRLRSYNGEESPYWKFLEEHQATNSDGKLTDDPLANPDVFAEEDSLFHRSLTRVGEIQLEAVHDTIATLSPQQQRVIQLCAFEGRTLEVAAAELGVKVSTVQVLLNRARAKIERRFAQQLMLEEK